MAYRRILLAFCIGISVTGCKWDAGLYDQFAGDGGKLVRCPDIDSAGQDEGHLGFLRLSEKTICCNPALMEEHSFIEQAAEMGVECGNFDDSFDETDAEESCDELDEECSKTKISGRELCRRYENAFKYDLCPGQFFMCDMSYGVYGYCRNDITATCDEDQIMCDTHCVDPKSDTMYCGAKGKCTSFRENSVNFRGVECSEGMICSDGACQCPEGMLRCGDKCIDSNNDMEYCGAKDDCEEDNRGENCYVIKSSGADKNICIDGKCTDISCLEGYHLDQSNRCVADTIDKCGSELNVCDQTGWEDGDCVKGKCQRFSCKESYHAHESFCLPDSLSACGSESNNCFEKQGFADGKCVNGNCVVTKCGVGYHEYEVDGTILCEEDSPSNCGAHDAACFGEGQWCIINGNQKVECVKMESCRGTNMKLCEDDSCVNLTSDRSCGDCYNDCTKKDGFHCSAETKTCVCKPGYTACGSLCVPPAYFENSAKHCGTCNNACPGGNNAACIKGRCSCVNGMIMVNGNCYNVEGDVKHCGTGLKDCTAIPNVAGVTCSSRKCIVTKCKEGYHISSNQASCVANTNAACAPSTSSQVKNCSALSSGYLKYTCGNNGNCTASCPRGFTVKYKNSKPYCECPSNRLICGGECVERNNEHCGACKPCAKGAICQHSQNNEKGDYYSCIWDCRDYNGYKTCSNCKGHNNQQCANVNKGSNASLYKYCHGEYCYK